MGVATSTTPTKLEWAWCARAKVQSFSTAGSSSPIDAIEAPILAVYSGSTLGSLSRAEMKSLALSGTCLRKSTRYFGLTRFRFATILIVQSRREGAGASGTEGLAPSAIITPMPTNKSKALRKPPTLMDNAEQRRLSAIRIAEFFAKAPGIAPEHRREGLSFAVWGYTTAEYGKWGCRFRSAGVLGPEVVSIQHEHVVPRKHIVDEILAAPGETRTSLSKTEACLVTAEEHKRLSELPDAVVGWNRYTQANVVVHDMLGDPKRTWTTWLSRYLQKTTSALEADPQL
jgi:hypothetical protein